MKQSKHKSTHKCDTERDKKVEKKRRKNYKDIDTRTLAHRYICVIREGNTKRLPYGQIQIVNNYTMACVYSRESYL